MDTDIKDTKDIKDIKYIFQKYNYNSFQCGAYAIYNLLHHCRHVVDLDYLIENCKADKNYGTLWLSNAGMPAWIQYDFGNAKIINAL